MDDFYKDLEIGKRGEKIVAAALEARGHKITDLSDDIEARFNDIDLLLDNGKQQTTLEVKNDLASEKTGNVFIETYNSRNISHSLKGWFFYCTAEFVCFLQENKKKAHIALLSDIKDNISNNRYREVYTGKTKGILMPIEAIKTLPSYFLLEV